MKRLLTINKVCKTMKLKIHLSLLAALFAIVASAAAQTSAFTYQGRFETNGTPVGGFYSLTFTLFDAASGGAIVGTPSTNDLVTVSNGLFTVTLDFGLAVFDGSDRWLELGVRPSGATDLHAPLLPRQAITATPYAIRSANAASASSVAAGAVGPSQLADGAVTTSKLGADVSAYLSINGGAWTRSGSNIVYSGGNAGIGTATPSNRLDVAGTVGAGGFSLPGGASFSGNQGGSLELGSLVSTSQIPFIDFHYGTGSNQDYNVRLINDASERLSIYTGSGLPANLALWGKAGINGGTSGLDGGNLRVGQAQGENGIVLYDKTTGLSKFILRHDTGYAQMFMLDPNYATAVFLNTAGNSYFNGGNVGIGNSNPTNLLMVSNARCDGSSWINASDRNLKQNFAPVNAQEILAKVVALPVQAWSYKAQPDQKHVGPVAQDFHAAFGLGQDNVSIATVDESGVALAAIQGLNQKVDEKDARIRELEAAVKELRQLVNQLATPSAR